MPRRILVAPVVFLLASCQPRRPPRTAVVGPPQGSIDLPASGTGRHYDTAIRPGDEVRPPTRVAANRAPAPARPPANALTEREKQAIAQWDREAAALNYDAPPLGLRPPPATGVKLAMPSNSALPQPAPEHAGTGEAERHRVGAAGRTARAGGRRRAGEGERRGRTATAARADPGTGRASGGPAGGCARRAADRERANGTDGRGRTAAVAAPPPAKPRIAPPADRPIARPAGEPAATVTFERRSADLSDGDRLLLEHFARGANTRRLRQVLLYGYAGAGDPVEARKLALARVLAVHAALIDLGLKADVEIGDFSQANEGSPDRVDVMLRY